MGHAAGEDIEILAGVFGVIGTLIGAVVGSLVSGYVAERQLTRSEFEKDKVAAFSIFRKLNVIYSAQVGIRRHWKAGSERALTRPGQPKCLALRPFANDPPVEMI